MSLTCYAAKTEWESFDQKHHVKERTNSFIAVGVAAVKEVDEKLKVTETLSSVAHKVISTLLTTS